MDTSPTSPQCADPSRRGRRLGAPAHGEVTPSRPPDALALAAAKAKGKRLGRPKGALGTSRLDGKEQDIRALLGKDVSKASSPRYWTSPAPPSTTSSRPARSLRADYKTRTALMLYFNTNVGATLVRKTSRGTGDDRSLD